MTMSGIHHVTAISGRAYRNLDFYTGTLGMRFVKKTVNFDDPGAYHLYYGDEVGHPGTILTFFAWEHASPGRSGVGFTHQTAFCVPANSLGYWTHRFIEKGAPHEPLAKRFGEPVVAFSDPDGMRLALVGVAEAETGWSGAQLRRLARWDADLYRLRRRRQPHSDMARARVHSGVAGPWRNCDRASLSWHGSHNQRRRDQAGHKTDCTAGTA
jgi:catechol 2,3-dioxygenase-like lactoylglutathione lyase family enzyme